MRARSIRMLAGAGLVGMMAVGCAPVVVAGSPGIGVSASPGAGPQIASCSGLGWHSPEAARMGVRSPMIQMRAFQNQIATLQSRFTLSLTANRNNPESWKAAASGECY